MKICEIPKDHLEKFAKKAEEMNLPQAFLAIRLNNYSCQRLADILKLKKDNIYKKGEYYFFDIIQNKTKNNVKLFNNK